MARYTGPVCKLCRREGLKLFLKGDRCYGEKCAIERRPYPPGQHGRGRIKTSDYGTQLREKQKVRRMYGLLEGQFRLTYEAADRAKGVTGVNLLRFLEKRLDNVVYRLGLSVSRPDARQLVRHGHIRVNGKKVDIPSFRVSVGDVVEVREKSKKHTRVLGAREVAERRQMPQWLEMNNDVLQGTIKAEPAREDITIPIEEHLIVELYSK
jgi:small subunit ribosomal protein S4